MRQKVETSKPALTSCHISGYYTYLSAETKGKSMIFPPEITISKSGLRISANIVNYPARM